MDAIHILALLALLAVSPLAVERAKAGIWLPAGYAIMLVSIAGIGLASTARPENGWLRWAHLLYPIVSVLLIFWSLYYIIPAVDPSGFRDRMLIGWDRAILGFEPGYYVSRFEQPVVSDVMHLFYISYFFFPFALLLALVTGKRWRSLHESIFVMVLGFFVCYAGYVLVPAEGPRFVINHTNRMRGYLLTQPIRNVIDALEPNKADVFPSAHAALTLVIAVLALRHARKTGIAMAALTPGILVSLIYCRYHYSVDVFCGIAVAVAVLLAGPRIFRWWEDRIRIRPSLDLPAADAVSPPHETRTGP